MQRVNLRVPSVASQQPWASAEIDEVRDMDSSVLLLRGVRLTVSQYQLP